MASWVVEAKGVADDAIQGTIAQLNARGFQIIKTHNDTSGTCSIESTLKGGIEISVSLPDRRGPSKPIRHPRKQLLDVASIVRDPASILAATAGSVMAWAQKYEALVNTIRDGRAVAFIGSGLSQLVDYPSWRALVKTLAGQAGIHISDSDIKAGSTRFPEIAEECKRQMPTTYYHILQDLFKEKLGLKFSSCHSLLWLMPFESYITTNYDPSLEIAAEKDGTKKFLVQSWPDFNLQGLILKHIIHLHGKVRRGDEGPEIIRTVRLTTSDYDEAYRDGEHDYIRDLIRSVVSSGQTFVFIGYSLSDPDLQQVLSEAWKKRNDALDFAATFGLGRTRVSTHFALLPSGSVGSPGALALMKDQGIEEIDYPTDGGGHDELFEIISDLDDRTRQVSRGRLYGSDSTIELGGPYTHLPVS